jgi:hypothetical protein
MEVSGQLDAPANLPQGKKPLVPIGKEASTLSQVALKVKIGKLTLRKEEEVHDDKKWKWQRE